MPKFDDKTLRGWPLPHRQNKLSDDADRLRETITAIDANITEIENDIHSVADANDLLTARMDVVVGSATEDTEILDARVDAAAHIHSNLGANIRNIHSQLLKARALIDSLQEQADDNAAAILQTLLDQYYIDNLNRERVAEEAELRESGDSLLQKKLNTEAETRASEDGLLQEQVDDNTTANLHQVLAIAHEIKKRKELENTFSVEVNALVSQTKELLQSAHNNDVRRLDEADVVAANLRYRSDNGLQEQIDTLADLMLQFLLSNYNAQAKVIARFSVIEQALIENGLLDGSDIPYSIDSDIQDMLDKIFSDEGTGEDMPEPLDEDDEAFFEDLDNIFNP